MNAKLDRKVNAILDKMITLKGKGLDIIRTKTTVYDRLFIEFMEITDSTKAMMSLSDETLDRIAGADF